ncbi:hypothetical protein PsorP6_012905 [Peronosclerospora sorghi]|uniref:Uncharacterized protein n=1 Tax=Peronosclerospora sorghi TaxID=230839 RepID=A0ACC0WFT9_9STRA|nr:hypothetical protein PsorP6_012905 [Peronosclerospora sorghi]
MSAPSALPRIIDNDSDSDDMPLSALRATKEKAVIKEEVKTEIKTQVVVNGVGHAKACAASDSDDDIPISGLVKRKKLKVETKVKNEDQVVPSRSMPKSTPRNVNKRVIKIKIRQQECTEKLYETIKGKLVQELLCRWWYAMEWPPAQQRDVKLHGVQELDGFPGAFIRVKGEDLGSILDTRSSIGKPSFLHFLAMPADDLLQLLLQAYDKQMQVLSEHEGPTAPLLKDLKQARASAAKINTEKADRSVCKVLKSFAELEREMEQVKALALKDEEVEDEEAETAAD